jgi:transketolase
MLAARFGRSLVDHRTWLLAGPTELVAGGALEAAAIAGAAPLNRLIVVAHVPATQVSRLAAFAAMGWAVRRLRSGDETAFETALAAAQRAQKPTLIACQIFLPTDQPGQPPAPLAEPTLDPVRLRAAGARRAWLKRLRRHANAENFTRAQTGRSPGTGLEALASLPDPGAVSPAAAVQAALRHLTPAWPDLAGLSPDGHFALPPASLTGRAVAWGERALATVAGLLGMALHGGVLPIAELSCESAETALPALRVAAAASLRTVHIVPEVAAVAAPLLAAWRALPAARLFRPADAAEAVECLSLALRHLAAPSVLLLTENLAAPLPNAPPRAAARGAYLLHDPPRRDITLIAGGSDIRLALAVRLTLAESGIAAACVSLPCWQLFAAQESAYRQHVLGTAPRVGLEAGDGLGWETLLGSDGTFIDTSSAPDRAGIAAALLRRLARASTDLKISHTTLGTDGKFD